MSVLRLYLDEDCQAAALAFALQAHGIDSSTTNEARHGGLNDAEQLQYATESGCAIVTNNISDFCVIHEQWLKAGRDHAGIIVFPQQAYSIGDIVRRLLRLQQTLSAEEMRNRLEWLSSWGAK